MTTNNQKTQIERLRDELISIYRNNDAFQLKRISKGRVEQLSQDDDLDKMDVATLLRLAEEMDYIVTFQLTKRQLND